MGTEDLPELHLLWQRAFAWEGGCMRTSHPGERQEASRGFEPRSLDSESRMLTVTPRGQVRISRFLGALRKSQVTYREKADEVDETSSERVQSQGLARI